MPSLVLSFRQSWQILNWRRISVFSCALFCASLIAMFFAPVNSAYANTCLEEQRKYEDLWPDNCECNILSFIASEEEKYNKLLLECVDKAKAKANCSNICTSYFETTASQCVIEDSIDNDCGVMCDTGADLNKPDSYRYFENEWIDERNRCMEQKKGEFIGSTDSGFIAKCIGELNNQSNEDRLIVYKGGSKSAPNFEEYCTLQAETAYGKPIESDEIVEYYFAIKDGHPGGRGDSYISREGSISYSTMTQKRSNVIVIAIDNWKRNNFTQEPDDPLEEQAKTDGLKVLEMCKTKRENQGTMPRCEAELKNALEEAQETCAELQTSAQECCHEPEECVGGGLAHALDGLGKLNVALSQFKSRKRQCDAVQQTFGAYGAMQGAMAAQCTNTADECVQGCNSALDKVVSAFEKACNYNPRTGGEHDLYEHTCTPEFFEKYVKEYKSDNNDQQISIAGVPEACKRTGREANRRIHDMSTNLGASLMASVKECDESGPIVPIQPPAPLTPLPPLPPPNPAGVPDPKPYDGGGGTKKLNVERNQLPSDTPLQQAANPFDQEPDIPPLEPKPKGVAGKMGGLIASGGSGGGGGGGLSGGGGGGGGGPGRGPAGGGGKKKKVLLGFKGGKFAGYGSGGGFDGEKEDKKRATAKRGKNKKGVAKLNLKKLLPKGKQLNHAVSKFGSPHDNIFQRLSNRYQWMCKTKRIDCE